MWGLDGNGTVYRYDPYFGSFVELYNGPNTGFAQIAAGGDGVWAMEKGSVSTENGFRLNSMAGYFVPEGSFWAQVAVGSGAGVWVINANDQVFTWVRP